LAACRRISSELGIGARHITISTVGLAPRIRQLALEPEQFTLAVSLHEANDLARSAIMPINRRYPLDELIDACGAYVEAKQRRITFEWALIAGVNDDPAVAHRLGRLLQPLRGKCHVNIIPLNPTGGFEGKPANPTVQLDSHQLPSLLFRLSRFGHR
jgi:23S rRNA (adenine2503-C2)-methyltransferase